MSTLSGTSALLSIFILALNSTIQPSGCFLIAPESLLVAFRSSPLIIAADIIITISRFITLATSNGPSIAIKTVALMRFEDYPQHVPKQYISATRILSIVLPFLSLLQLVKLAACSGIIWTQLVAGIFAAGYIGNWSLCLLWMYLHPDEVGLLQNIERSERKWQAITHIAGTWAIGLQATLWTQIVHTALPTHIDAWLAQIDPGWRVITAAGLAVLGVLCAYGMFFVLMLLLNWGSGVSIFVKALGMIGALCCSVVQAITIGCIYGSAAYLRYLAASATVLVLCVVVFIGTNVIANAMVAARRARGTYAGDFRSPVLPVVVTFLTLQLTTVVLFYMKVYDAKGTDRPWWTTFLG